MSINKLFEAIEESDLQALVDNNVPEGKTLEYKESLHSDHPTEKKEFLADVSSFANAAGGDLIHGIRLDKIMVSQWRFVVCRLTILMLRSCVWKFGGRDARRSAPHNQRLHS